jgi:ribonucleoside-diphosphate reductase alpha chain
MIEGYPYDSEKARNYTAAICSIMTGFSYYISSLMAEKIAPFETYESTKNTSIKCSGIMRAARAL